MSVLQEPAYLSPRVSEAHFDPAQCLSADRLCGYRTVVLLSASVRLCISRRGRRGTHDHSGSIAYLALLTFERRGERLPQRACWVVFTSAQHAAAFAAAGGTQIAGTQPCGLPFLHNCHSGFGRSCGDS